MATAALLRSGDAIGGFRIDDVIGIGGMAIVYRAEQISLGRPVALKVLTSKLTRDEVFRERFRREGTHAAGLEHPNIVPVYDSGEQDGNLYIAMRLVEGTNLAELIQTRGVTADQTIELLRPIASALDTAHAAGLIHRDVKPQNILITTHGHPYLADFGVAKGSNTEGLTATGGFVGSIHYASPEQIKGLTLTPASDVYALTAVLYQCLTGNVPFPRETDASVMHAQLHDPPPTLPTASGADSDFHTVLARGMAKDPGARYGHAGDLINAAALSVSRLPTESRKTVPAFPERMESAEPTEHPVDTPPANETEIVAADELAAVRSTASLTAADRRRPAALEPEFQAAASRRRWPVPAGIVVGTIAAIALAVVLLTTGGKAQAKARHGGDPQSARQPSHSSTLRAEAHTNQVSRPARHLSPHARPDIHRHSQQARHAAVVDIHSAASATHTPVISNPSPSTAVSQTTHAPASNTPAPSAPAPTAPAPSTPAPSTPAPSHHSEPPQVVVSAPK